MDKLCAIISGGEYSPMTDIGECEYVIACDRGYEYARRAGVTPDLILGDFDSYSGALPEGAAVLRLPTEKDDTDTMAAMRRALDAGYTRIRIYCALGGRLDHLMANIQCAAFAARQGVRVTLYGAEAEIYVLSGGTLTLAPREGYSLSVLALSDAVRGVYIRGAKYALEDAEITNFFPIGASNEWRGTAQITIGTGVAAVMLCRMPPK